MSAGAIPYTVIGGYLGAGKTTLLNHLLRCAGGLRLAVLVNDFGDVSIDVDLIEDDDGDTIALANGCICCTMADGLAAALRQLGERRDDFDHVVIEASGVSDPARVGQYAAPFGFALSGVIVVADAQQVRDRAADRVIGETVVRHLRGADLVVLNKIDLVDAAALADTRAWLTASAPGVAVIEAVDGTVPVPLVLGAVSDRAVESPRPDVHERYESWSFEESAPLRRSAVEAFVAALPQRVVRVKGFVHLMDDPDHRYVLQVVGRRSRLTRHRAWDATPLSRLLVIAAPGGSGGPRFALLLGGDRHAATLVS